MNKHVRTFLMCLCLFSISMHAAAQTDSIAYSGTYGRIIGNADLAVGKVRGFELGDSITTVLHCEKGILEAQGDDFLYYRVLCDSTLSVEISYTFDEKGLLISIGIEFFELCKDRVEGHLSDTFLINFRSYYTNCINEETDTFRCKSVTGTHIDYKKTKSEMRAIHTEIEFY